MTARNEDKHSPKEGIHPYTPEDPTQISKSKHSSEKPYGK